MERCGHTENFTLSGEFLFALKLRITNAEMRVQFSHVSE